VVPLQVNEAEGKKMDESVWRTLLSRRRGAAYLTKNMPFWWIHRIDILAPLSAASCIGAIATINPIRQFLEESTTSLEGTFLISLGLTLILSCLWLLSVSRTLKIKGAMLLSRSPSYLVLVLGLALINLPMFFMANSISGSGWGFDFYDSSHPWSGGAFFLWMIFAGYLGLFVCIGMRMSFASARTYHGILLATLVTLLITVPQLTDKAAAWHSLTFGGLYLPVFAVAGLALAATLISSFFMNPKLEKISIMIFLITVPLLGSCLGMLFAEVAPHPEVLAARWSPFSGVPLMFILLGVCLMILIAEFALAYARRIWSRPE
jgi:hypothetical protein